MAPVRIFIFLIMDGLLGSLWLIHFVFSGEKFKAVFLRMSQLASSGPTELRVRSLDAISQLLTLQVFVCAHMENIHYHTSFFLCLYNLQKKKSWSVYESIMFHCSQSSRQKTSWPWQSPGSNFCLKSPWTWFATLALSRSRSCIVGLWGYSLWVLSCF